MDALAYLKNGPSIDRLKSAEDIAKDEDYDKKGDNATPEKTQNLKTETLRSLYGVKSAEEFKISNQTKTEIGDDINSKSENIQDNKDKINNPEEEKNLKIDENPNSPLIDKFVNDNRMSSEEGDLVKEALTQEGDIEENISKIEGLDSEKQKQIIDSIKYLDSENGKTKCRENFNRDFAVEIEGLKKEVPGGKKGEKLLTENQENLVEKLGGNYLSSGGEEIRQTTDKEALDRALKMTLNQIITDAGKTFKRPAEFDIMKGIVNNGNLSFKERFDELSTINNEVINSKAKSNGKQSKEFKNRQDKQKQNNLTLDEKFNKFKEEVKISTENKDYNRLKELKKEGSEIKEETENSGEVFEGGDIDKLLGDIENTLKEGA